MAMSISNIGVGSGLPLEKLLADMRAQENQALAVIKNRYDVSQSRISAYAALKAAVEKVSAAGEALGKDNVLGAVSASGGGDSFSVSSGNQAIAGHYQVQVKSLASTQTLVSGGRADAAAPMAGGRITFTLANGKQAELDLGGREVSMQDVVAAINKDNTLGVRATLLNDGSGTPHRLLLSSEETGTEAAIARVTVSGAADSTLQDLLGFDASMARPGAGENTSGEKVTGENITGLSERVPARNAQVEIDGIAVSSPSNTLKNAIAGVTLTLNKAGEAQTLTLARDDAPARAAVKGLVDAYNALQGAIAKLTAFDVTAGSSGPLTGDAVARRVQNLMRGALDMPSGAGGFSTLNQIGIRTDPISGQLQIDNTKLEQALGENLPLVRGLLLGDALGEGLGEIPTGTDSAPTGSAPKSSGGLIAQIKAAAASITERSGLIPTASDGAQRSAKLLDGEYRAAAERIDQRLETYRQQFVALDASVAQMSGISNYLAQQLAMLGSQHKG